VAAAGEKLIASALRRGDLRVAVAGDAKSVRIFVAIERGRNTHVPPVNSCSTKVAVIGASGYAGEELVRLLLQHPFVELTTVTSRQYASRSLGEIYPRFAHLPKAQKLTFTEADAAEISRASDIVFLALPHGVSAETAVEFVRLGTKIIDLSADFRLRDEQVYLEFYGKKHAAPELLKEAVYGLPELHREKIRNGSLIACPGCYPTSILLPLAPLVKARAIDPARIIVASLSGVTGAGRKTEAEYLFAECNDSLRPYGVPKHRHLSEIEQEIAAITGERVPVQFTPHLVPVNRGIVSTVYADLTEKGDAVAIERIFQQSYGKEPFVRLLGEKALPDTKNVVATNFIDLAWRIDSRTNRLILMSAIDNLTKGTSGQAVQCMNLMCGYEETTGLL
jgi:N-acetyl-gamma-glutamyl-phosphate reductase